MKMVRKGEIETERIWENIGDGRNKSKYMSEHSKFTWTKLKDKPFKIRFFKLSVGYL